MLGWDMVDSTNTMKSCRVKLNKSKRSVVNCFEGKNHTQLSKCEINYTVKATKPKKALKNANRKFYGTQIVLITISKINQISI
jgi:hypothetical protein